MTKCILNYGDPRGEDSEHGLLAIGLSQDILPEIAHRLQLPQGQTEGHLSFVVQGMKEWMDFSSSPYTINPYQCSRIRFLFHSFIPW